MSIQPIPLGLEGAPKSHRGEPRRVQRPAEVESAVQWAMAEPGPVLVDVVTSADEVAVPPKPTLKQWWGFAIAKSKEFLVSPD